MLSPILLYFAIVHKSIIAIIAVILCVVDLLMPLKLPYYSHTFHEWIITPALIGKMLYFPMDVVFEVDPSKLSKEKNYMVCIHPHSLYGIGYEAYAQYLIEQGFEPLLAGADVVFQIPLVRRLLQVHGATRVTKTEIKRSLARKFPQNIVTLAVGGIAEMFCEETPDGKGEIIVAKRRKGHIKLALETGASILPCYTFGANQFITRISKRGSIFEKVSRKIRASIFLWLDAFYIPFGFIPKQVPMLVVVGAPIEFPDKMDTPSQRQIDEYHEKYLTSMTALFDKYKSRLGPKWSAKNLVFEDFDSKI
eukprot:CAMPEP_0167740318 /NCGR_PEP_ID=MMETSP0110_2-20121227/207_1 /TAXON_ID=629695 /ORGANISM="Gymnochlora sp., Strain CCMP2014" /LENGTH=306 /DNA_ID=CAMNT_0007624191 /DNA_START=142 /DNA_END=1062 /DNA_ORIENTATION=+